jgi:hypothetical protein
MEPAALRWLLIPAISAACAQPLPDAQSAGAKAYVQECGVCHAPHQPGLLTAAMWKVQFARMEQIRQQRGLPPTTAASQKLILDYLTTHAG